MAIFDQLLKTVAFIFGVSFVIGYLMFPQDSIDARVLMLSHSLLMFLCVAQPRKANRQYWIAALAVTVVLAVVDFYIRVSSEMKQLNYPPDLLLIYSAEIVIVIRFAFANVEEVKGHGGIKL